MLLSTFLILQFHLLLIHINANHLSSSKSTVSCSYNYGNQTIYEGETIKINGRLYKIEDCQLQRAFQTCRKHLWFMIHIVCSTVEAKKKEHRCRIRRALNKILLTEACCHNACTISEMTRYCPN